MNSDVGAGGGGVRGGYSPPPSPNNFDAQNSITLKHTYSAQADSKSSVEL